MGADFPIHIRFPLGETIQILIDGINNIAHLKSQIEIEAWVPFGKGAEFWTKTFFDYFFFRSDVQRLIFDEHELEDKKLLFDYNIQRGSPATERLTYPLIEMDLRIDKYYH